MSKIPPTGTQYEIRSGDHTAVLVEVGGGLRAYTVAGEDFIDGYAEDELAPAGAGEVLAPWPNRVRDGHYRWRDQSHQLAINEVDKYTAIHGLVRWLPWEAVSKRDSAVTLRCVLSPQAGYPWRLELTTTWSVGPEGLRAEHTAGNLSDTAAPFGFGVHPYLQLPGVKVDDLVLTVPADRVVLVDQRLLPIGAHAVTGTEWDFTGGRRIGATKLDTAYGLADTGGGSAAVLSTVDGTRRLRLWADPVFHWWQAFTGDSLPAPRHRRSVALEPMTCPPDAFNSGRDVIMLEPGDTWRGAWGITPELG